MFLRWKPYPQPPLACLPIYSPSSPFSLLWPPGMISWIGSKFPLVYWFLRGSIWCLKKLQKNVKLQGTECSLLEKVYKGSFQISKLSLQKRIFKRPNRFLLMSKKLILKKSLSEETLQSSSLSFIPNEFDHWLLYKSSYKWGEDKINGALEVFSIHFLLISSLKCSLASIPLKVGLSNHIRWESQWQLM